ncbi:MAG: PaaI family thioesterase [Pseudomonadota bacterium]
MEISADLLAKLNQNPLYRTLGIAIETAVDGVVTACLQPTPGVCWPVLDRPHGGILFTLMDTTMATSVMCDADTPQVCSTVGLDIQYPDTDVATRYRCSTAIEHRTRRLTFVRGEIRSAGGILMALGQGTFRMRPGDWGLAQPVANAARK